MTTRQVIRRYYDLAKPGIVYGNAIAFVAGYFAYAQTVAISWDNFLSALAGICLVMASSCVANNMYDSDIDAKMQRTSKRSLVVKDISMFHAAQYMAVLLVAGALLLLHAGGLLATLLSLTGWFLYAVIYTRSKRHTRHSTLIGTLPGALPPVIGYAAISNTLDYVVLALFIAMVGWQMVHFLAIALYRKQDYKAAGIPVTPVVLGDNRTRTEMQYYAMIFAGASLMLGYWLGVVYSVATTFIIFWMIKQLMYPTSDIARWAKKQFLTSLVVLLMWSATIVIAAVL